MFQQVKNLHSDMRKTEASLRANQRALQQTERKADRLHRKLRGQPS